MSDGEAQLSELLERANAREAETLKDLRASRRGTVAVAILGSCATLAAAWVTTDRQDVAAQDQFLRQERKVAYSEFIGSLTSLHYAIQDVLQSSSLNEPLDSRTSYEAAKDDLEAMLDQEWRTYGQSFSVVNLVGSKAYRKLAGECFDSFEAFLTSVAEAIERAHKNGTQIKAAWVEDYPAKTCDGLQSTGRADFQ